MAKTKEEKRKGAWERNMLYLRQYMKDWRQEKSEQILEKTLTGIRQCGQEITLESAWLTNKSFIRTMSAFQGSFEQITVNTETDTFVFTRSDRGHRYYRIDHSSSKSGKSKTLFAHLYDIEGFIQILNEHQSNWKPKE